MRGDKILVQEKHHRAATAISQILLPRLTNKDSRFAVSIAGESGSGKSELAVATAEALEQHGIGTLILQQDDYFTYPPHTNDTRRRKDITRVGPAEVCLDLLDDHIRAIINGATKIDKPLVLYQEDLITSEVVPLAGADVVIVEGTYTTLLKNVDFRIFIDCTYEQTRNERLKRNREPADPFLERVLRIEHKIISTHKNLADILVTASFAVENHGVIGATHMPQQKRHEDLSKEVIAEGSTQSTTV
jgi:uridine kinase